MTDITLDQTDLNILTVLQKDAWATTKAIARSLSVKEKTVFNRIDRLRQLEIITGSTIFVSNDKLRTVITAYTHVHLNNHSGETFTDFQREVSTFPEVLECYQITGVFDFLLKVVVNNMAEYNNFAVERLSKVSHVGSLQTDLVIHESKRTLSHPIELQFPALKKHA